jgi:hypothetical protein
MVFEVTLPRLVPNEEGYKQVREAVERALALNPNLAEDSQMDVLRVCWASLGLQELRRPGLQSEPPVFRYRLDTPNITGLVKSQP